MPVSGMNDLQVEIPSSFRSSSFVPSPFIIVALGRIPDSAEFRQHCAADAARCLVCIPAACRYTACDICSYAHLADYSAVLAVLPYWLAGSLPA